MRERSNWIEELSNSIRERNNSFAALFIWIRELSNRIREIFNFTYP